MATRIGRERTMDDIEVIQADWEAADRLDSLACLTGVPAVLDVVAKAFARHRIAALAALEASGRVVVRPEDITAMFETSDGLITGTTDAQVKRVERQDDGTITVVIDHWPSGMNEEASNARHPS